MNMSSTITRTGTVARWAGRALVLALVALAVVALGQTTSYTPYTGTAAPTTQVQYDAPAPTPQGPALSVRGLSRDMVAELLTRMDFTGDAPVLADVTTVYGPDQVDVEDMDGFEIGLLLGMGYRGDPSDGHERLYAPGTH
jgi:hypothetical protein